MSADGFVCTLELDDDPLERTARLPRLRGRGPAKSRTVAPGRALPLSGVGLVEWQRWIDGEEVPLYACRRAVV